MIFFAKSLFLFSNSMFKINYDRVAGTAYTLQRLALAPWAIQSAVGNSVVELGLLLRRLGVHSLYIPSYVKSHHIRYARALVPFGYGASNAEIGGLVAQGMMSLGAIGVVGAVGTAAVAEYVVPVVCADQKAADTLQITEGPAAVEKIDIELDDIELEPMPIVLPANEDSPPLPVPVSSPASVTNVGDIRGRSYDANLDDVDVKVGALKPHPQIQELDDEDTTDDSGAEIAKEEDALRGAHLRNLGYSRLPHVIVDRDDEQKAEQHLIPMSTTARSCC